MKNRHLDCWNHPEQLHKRNGVPVQEPPNRIWISSGINRCHDRENRCMESSFESKETLQQVLKLVLGLNFTPKGIEPGNDLILGIVVRKRDPMMFVLPTCVMIWKTHNILVVVAMRAKLKNYSYTCNHSQNYVTQNIFLCVHLLCYT